MKRRDARCMSFWTFAVSSIFLWNLCAFASTTDEDLVSPINHSLSVFSKLENQAASLSCTPEASSKAITKIDFNEFLLNHRETFIQDLTKRHAYIPNKKEYYRFLAKLNTCGFDRAEKCNSDYIDKGDSFQRIMGHFLLSKAIEENDIKNTRIAEKFLIVKWKDDSSPITYDKMKEIVESEDFEHYVRTQYNIFASDKRDHKELPSSRPSPKTYREIEVRVIAKRVRDLSDIYPEDFNAEQKRTHDILSQIIPDSVREQNCKLGPDGKLVLFDTEINQ